MERFAALLLFLPLVPACHALGALLLSGIVREEPPPWCPRRRPPPAVVTMSLGVWTLVPLLFLLAALGWLTPWVARTLYLLLAGLGFWWLPATLRALGRDIRSPWRRAAGLERLSLIIFAALAGSQVIGAATHPFGADSLAYHFPVARHLLETGSLEPLYGLPPSCYLPQNPHLYYAFGMQVHSDVLGKAFVTFWGLLTYGLVYRLGRTLFGPRAGRLALLVYAFTPWTIYKVQFAFVEIPLAHALLTATHLLIAHVRRSRAGPLLACGGLVGIALGIKITAWVLVPLLAGAGLLTARSHRPSGRARLWPVAAAVLLAGLLGSPWCVRNLHYLGNPVWPFLGVGKYIASGHAYGEKNFLVLHQPEVVLEFLRTLFLNYGKDCFSFFSPFLLMLLPFLPGVALRLAPARALLAASGLGLLFCYALAPFSARYWFPFFALVSPVLALAGLEAARRKIPAAVFSWALLLIGIGVLGYQATVAASLLRFGDRESLYATLPESGLRESIRRDVAPATRVVYPYENLYIFPGNVIPAWCNNGWLDLASEEASQTLPRRMAELGARYLVYSEERSSRGRVYDRAYSRTVKEILDRGLARVVVHCGDLTLLEVVEPSGNQSVTGPGPLKAGDRL